MTVQKEQQITIEISPEFAMHVAERILTAMGGRISSKSSNAIVAHKGISPKSWGEDITISLISSGTGGSVIKIKSVSSLKTTLIDWGANVNNVETIVQTYKDVGTLMNKAMQNGKP